MEVRIKIDKLDLSEKEFRILENDLEELLKINPAQAIKISAQKMNLCINEKHIIKTNNSLTPYKVEFYHNNKEGKKPNYLGSIDYPPKDIK